MRKVVTLTCVALLAGCGGSSSPNREVDYTKGPGVNPSIAKANCTDWQRGTEFQRRRTVVQLREFAGGQVGSSAVREKGKVLDDASAYTLLQNYCRNQLARGFRLYKLYERAAAFVGR